MVGREDEVEVALASKALVGPAATKEAAAKADAAISKLFMIAR
jgi:hypothetical protein